MGWKAFKEHFGIQHHVIVRGDRICIGSSYVHNLVEVDCKTGEVHGRCAASSSAFSGFLSEHYPNLAAASAKEILALINQPDHFEASIPVYTYVGSQIIEKRCEKLGWPHPTHDGQMQYVNTFSTDKQQVIAWAKRDAQFDVLLTIERIAELEQHLAQARARLAEQESVARQLDTHHPDIPAATR